MDSKEKREARAMRVLDFLKREAIRGEYWFVLADIQAGTRLGYALAKQAVFDLAVMGFLQIRDGDTAHELIRIALKPGLRDMNSTQKAAWKKRQSELE